MGKLLDLSNRNPPQATAVTTAVACGGFQSVMAHLTRYERRWEEAGRQYLENLRHMLEQQLILNLPESMEDLAMAALELQQYPAAIRLFGASHRVRKHINTPMPPILKPEYYSAIQRLNELTSKAQYDRLWTEGEDSSAEAAVTTAMNIFGVRKFPGGVQRRKLFHQDYL